MVDGPQSANDTRSRGEGDIMSPAHRSANGGSLLVKGLGFRVAGLVFRV